MQNQSTNAVEPTKFGLQTKFSFGWQSVEDYVQDFDEMFFDCIGAEYADDYEYRQKLIMTHHFVKDVLMSIEIDPVTNELKLKVTHSL